MRLRALDRVPVGDALARRRRTPARRHSTRTAGRGQRRSVIGIVHCRHAGLTTTRMKCPKCGYLGFETTDRCRNCQYRFLTRAVLHRPRLALQSADRRVESNGDFELPAIKRQTDSLSASALDLDRLFGTAEPAVEATAATVSTGADDAIRRRRRSKPVADEPPSNVVGTPPTSSSCRSTTRRSCRRPRRGRPWPCVAPRRSCRAIGPAPRGRCVPSRLQLEAEPHGRANRPATSWRR